MQMRTLSRTALGVLAACALSASMLAQETEKAPERPRFPVPQGPQVASPEVHRDGRVSFRILAPKAEAVRLGGTDIPPEGDAAANPMLALMGRPMTRAEHGRLGGDGRPGRARRPVHLQHRRRRDDRPAQLIDQRVEHERLEPGGRAGQRPVRREGRAPRRRGRGHVLLEVARPFRRMHVYTPPGYERERDDSPSSTCSTARPTPTTRGRRSAAPGSSSTT